MLVPLVLALTLQVQPLAPTPVQPACGDQAMTDALDKLFEAMRKENAAKYSAEFQGAAAAARAHEARERETVNPRIPATALAPAIASSAGSPVDQALITPLLAFGLQTGLVEGDGKAITVSLNGLAIATAFSPDIVDATGAYRDAEGLRRLGGKVTLGGAGDRFDRDGDGKEDEPLAASALGDSIGWDVQYRLIGSRDRREKKVAEGIIAAMRTGHEEADVATAVLLKKLREIDPALCVAALPQLLERPAVARLLNTFTYRAAAFREEVDAALEAADRAPVLTAFAAGVNRKDELGPDKISFGLRALWGTRRLDHTLNATWAQVEGEPALKKPTTIKVAYEGSGLLMTSLLGYQAKYGLFASWERFQNVPTAKHHTVAQLGGKVEVDLATGVKVPITVRWVNHRDLLSGADDVVGNIGISIDLADLKKKAAEK